MSDKMSTISCPECGRKYDVSGLSAGTKARCKCGCKFDVSSGRIVEQGMPPPATSVGRQQARLGDTTNLGSRDALEAVESLAQAKDAVLEEVGKIIIGQREVLDQILTAFFAFCFGPAIWYVGLRRGPCLVILCKRGTKPEQQRSIFPMGKC